MDTRSIRSRGHVDALRSRAAPPETGRTVGGEGRRTQWSGRPGSLPTPAPHRSGRAGSSASGSSTDGFATRARPSGWPSFAGEGIARGGGEPLPRHRSLLRPTVEPLLPDVDDVKAARRQARGVPRNPVVGTVPPQLRHQHPMLLGNRRVAVHPAPAVNGGQGPPEAVLRRLSLEHPAAGPGESPVVREPQNVEPAGWWESVTVLPRAPTTSRSAERDQTTLHRVHRETKAPEAFRQHIPHPVWCEKAAEARSVLVESPK